MARALVVVAPAVVAGGAVVVVITLVVVGALVVVVAVVTAGAVVAGGRVKALFAPPLESPQPWTSSAAAAMRPTTEDFALWLILWLIAHHPISTAEALDATAGSGHHERWNIRSHVDDEMRASTSAACPASVLSTPTGVMTRLATTTFTNTAATTI